MSINLTDAAKFFNEEPHQIEAWNWLQGTLTPETLETFASKYRTKPTSVVDSETVGMVFTLLQNKLAPNFLNVFVHSGHSNQAGASTFRVPGMHSA